MSCKCETWDTQRGHTCAFSTKGKPIVITRIYIPNVIPYCTWIPENVAPDANREGGTVVGNAFTGRRQFVHSHLRLMLRCAIKPVLEITALSLPEHTQSTYVSKEANAGKVQKP